AGEAAEGDQLDAGVFDDHGAAELLKRRLRFGERDGADGLGLQLVELDRGVLQRKAQDALGLTHLVGVGGDEDPVARVAHPASKLASSASSASHLATSSSICGPSARASRSRAVTSSL